VTPLIRREHRLVPGPPKRFAQGVGLAFTVAASVAWATGAHGASHTLIAALVVAASLEAVLAVCLGCSVFNRLMRWHLIPASVCAECADIRPRLSEMVAHDAR